MPIVYYSWSGHTAALAKQIQSVSHADIYEIQVPSGTFSTDMYETSDIAKEQLKTGKLPPLSHPIPDLTDYDMVLIGGPVWSGAPSTPVMSFLSELKDDNLQLAPFYTDAGTAGDYVAAFNRIAGKHTVAAGLGMSGAHVASAQQQIQQWLNQL